MTREEYYDQGMAEFAMAEYGKAIDCYQKAVGVDPDYFDAWHALGMAYLRAGKIQDAIAAGTVRACHDLSEGGLAVAAAEMAFGGGLGMEINVAGMPVPMRAAGPTTAALLFGESAGRFLVEVSPERYDAFLRIIKDCPFGELGRITPTGRVVIKSLSRIIVDVPISQALAAWRGTFNW